MLRGSDIIAEGLLQEGSQIVFGQVGHSITHLLDAIVRAGIRYVSARHEQVAAHAADAYARLTGKPSTLILHVGPGLANGLIGVANAAVDCVPMIVLAGDVPTYHWGKEPFQELRLHADASQFEVLRPVVKRAWRVHSADALGEILARAFNVALSGRPGPVLIDLPMDIASSASDAPVPNLASRRPTGRRAPGDPREVERAAQLLRRAERAAIFVDHLALQQGAGGEVLALAEHLGLPIASTGMAKGVVDEEHPLSMGAIGLRGSPAAHRAMREADVILAIGTTFPEVDCSSWDGDKAFRIPPAMLIQIDSDPYEIGKIYPVDVGIVGDTPTVVGDLLARLRELGSPVDWRRNGRIKELVQELEVFRSSLESARHSAAEPIESARIVREIEEVLQSPSIVVTDVGFNKYLVHQQMRFGRARSLLMAGSFAPMGFGPPAALGAKLARPEAQVLALVGDGAMSSVESTLATAVEYDIAAVWVVLNNYAYGVVRPIQINRYDRRMVGSEFRTTSGLAYNPDFAALARSHGMSGVRIESPEDFRPALAEALDSAKPALLDVIVSPDVAAPITGIWDMMNLQMPSEHVHAPSRAAAEPMPRS